jgi:DNA-directed RNA polymerase specialized sigma24 family protein
MKAPTNRVTEAEQYLLDRIRRGNEQAWLEFVDRYRGRLLSFAQAKLLQSADAEDAVQETFDKPSDPFADLAGPAHTASWYVRADEKCELQRLALDDALSRLVDGFKSSLNFRDMQITELLFYCQLSNQDVAKVMDIKENAVALIKHRSLKQIRKHVAASEIPVGPSSTEFEHILTDIWEFQRPSCPKRSTIGAYLLETLDEEWHKYVDFHVNTLGCKFCRANLEDLKSQSAESQSTKLRARIMQSTAGFLNKKP